MADTSDLLGIFLMEAWDSVATLEDGLDRVRAPEVAAATVRPLVVVTHRLKGAAGLHDFPELSGAAGAAEQLLGRVPDAALAERIAIADFLRDLVVLLKKVLDGIAAGHGEDVAEIGRFRARHFQLAGEPAGAPAGAAVAAAPVEPARAVPESDDILAYFAPEAAEHLETMTRALLALERSGRDEEELHALFRAAHTLKGAAYTVGCAPVGDLAHRLEDLLVAVREARQPLTPAVVEVAFLGIDALRGLVGVGGAPADGADAAAAHASDRIAALTAGEEEPAAEPEPRAPAVPFVAPAREAAAERGVPAGERRAAAAGPFIRVSLDRLDVVMNQVGELVIARSRLDRRLRELDRVGELLQFSRARMARAVRDFEGGVRPRNPDLGDHPDGRMPRIARPDPTADLFAELEFDRYDDFDILARSVAELSADLGEVQAEVGGLIRSIWDDTAQIQRLTGSLRTEITRARMVRVGRLFTRFARQVREAARTAGKAVAFEVRGESVELDNSVIDQIADPLLHLVQNAITHGIESDAERQALGKPVPGTVRLSAAHRGAFVHIEVEDDGRGIDVERLKSEALRQGFLRQEQVAQLSPREALNLVFLPGFSTAPVVTTAAGRGVGMDVVRTNVTRLNGEIEVETEPGAGTRFRLKLPLTVVVSDALTVHAGGHGLAIALNAVRLVLTVRREEIRVVGRTEMVRVDGEWVDLVRLPQLLGLPADPARERLPVVVLRAGGAALAVAVDELGGKEEIVIKSLGGYPQGLGPFTGATISGDGRVILVLDPTRLLELAEAAGRDAGLQPAAGRRPADRDRRAVHAEAAAGAPAERRVLLVDDSISVRKFVGHMLERAGFRVLTANDGVDALQQLAETQVDTVITDLEMPRLNGYELIEDLRRRPATRHLPVVVLTTRAGEKHWALARRLGVEHYVSKPVDEQAFVRLLRSITAAERVEPALVETAP
jgi:chemosensory pili system protein ChpA (sensor histidine kinase/response regulator)